MNVLIINHYAGSPELGMEFRPYYMAKEWIRMNHNVLILGASYSHLRKKQPNESFTFLDEVNYSWIPTNKYKGNGLGRILSICRFVFELILRSDRYLRNFKPDIVIASSTYPLDIYPAHKIAKKYNAKLIYEVHDLWPLSPIELGGYSPKHPYIRMIQKAENYAYKQVDAVVSMLPNAQEHMFQHGLSKGKFFYIPNGIVLSDWQKPMGLPPEHSLLFEKLKKEGWFIIGFAGAHGIANSLKSIIDSVSQLKEEKICLVMVGTGQEKQNLIDYTNYKQIDNVHFLPPVNKLSVPNVLSEMDVLYIGLQKQSLFRFGISPNKIFDYMMSAKPVIQAIEAGNDIVSNAKCGMSVEPENIVEISNAIIELKKMSVEERTKLGINGRNYVINNHTYDVLAKRFMDVLNNLI